MGSMKQRAWAAAIAAVCVAFLLMPGICRAGVDEWAWMGGSNTGNQVGVYGTKGVPDAANVPGARTENISWADNMGNLWLFGGFGYGTTTPYGYLNDLWRYDPATNQWTWVGGSNTYDQAGVYGTKGVPDAANVPGARKGSISWIDNTGKLWLFGGGGRNDLWRYDPATNQWTWMSGSNTSGQVGVYGIKGVPDAANVPGARSNSISWTDSTGNLWLFGGNGYGSTTRGDLNDLWRYDPSTNQWTWMSGSNTVYQVGVYGTKGVPDAANVPGARVGSISWTDSTGNLWLFGGGSTITSDYLNDLWRYDPATNQWTWMSGANTVNQVGVYGTRGVPDAANVPGARFYSVSWTDSTGNLWLFGGVGYGSTTKGGLNDLWRYAPETNQWTWVGGSNTLGQAGVYGTRGVPDAANVPGARYYTISWTDNTGNLWLFGGYGKGSISYGYLNDLWRYELPQCETDEDCDEAEVCRQQQCFGACAIDADCADGLLCNGVETCIDGLCLAGSWPCQAGQYCDEEGERCFECLGSAECVDGLFCNGVEGCVEGECAAGSLPCSGEYVCDEPHDRCVECLVSDDCPEGELCKVSVGSCVECFNNNDCPQGEFCIVSVGSCVECVSNADCGDGVYCNGVETCVGGECVGTPPCRDGEICDEALGCAQCLSDVDCGGAESCKVASGVCVECSADEDCSAFYTCLYGMCEVPAYAQWTWVGGSIWAAGYGVYGTRGVPAADNVPLRRDRSISWTDSTGNLWLFGGVYYDFPCDHAGCDDFMAFYLNDLWRYDAFNNKWTWMGGSNTKNQVGVYGTKGVPAAANVPGARDGSISWTDSTGNLWLFGGNYSEYGSYMNDLWRYNPETNQWTWVSGANTKNQVGVYGTKGVPAAANVPGARDGSISWTDSTGNLWLFGGYGYGSTISGSLNDLWRYDPATNQWTWMGGANTTNQVGVYGTKGVPDAANVPGARNGSISWTDSTGNLWLFGGYGYDSTTTRGYLNDLWRYDLETNQWIWMSGANTLNQVGVYGTRGVPATANVPGARRLSISWTDSTGNLWLFGGDGYGSTATTGRLNDLWRYDPETNQWTWVGGANTISQLGVYGTKGVPDAANVPGARYGSISWTDNTGNLWLFGGYGYGQYDNFDDLWRYELPQCASDSDCPARYMCVEAICEPIPDDPPSFGDGPFVAAGYWPLLSSSQQSPTYFKQNRIVVWSFSDDFASCSEDCTHTAEYSVAGSDSWNALTVSSDAAEGYAYVNLPVASLQNGTYAFRFTVTDCAGQTTQSGTYYFQVARPDKLPVITDGPFLAAGWWPVLPTSQESPMVLKKNYSVLWTFGDDFVSCSGACTHTAEYQIDGGTSTSLSVSSDAAQGYAWVDLPIDQMQNGTYAFRFDVTDCAGQKTLSKDYYFKVNKPL